MVRSATTQAPSPHFPRHALLFHFNPRHPILPPPIALEHPHDARDFNPDQSYQGRTPHPRREGYQRLLLACPPEQTASHGWNAHQTNPLCSSISQETPPLSSICWPKTNQRTSGGNRTEPHSIVSAGHREQLPIYCQTGIPPGKLQNNLRHALHSKRMELKNKLTHPVFSYSQAKKQTRWTASLRHLQALDATNINMSSNKNHQSCLAAPLKPHKKSPKTQMHERCSFKR